ncbi:MAG: PilN domain-containing protein [Clostridium sp.]|uniref:PilN domain-containing protein n=1 Tax=Clostridium sp. TaxID=1506 RepID=UPI002FC67538
MGKELNLLPREYGKGTIENRRKNNTLIAIVAIALMVALSFGGVTARELYLNIQNNKLKMKLQESKSQVLEKERLQLQIDLTKKHIQVANSLKTIKDKDTDELIKLLKSEAEKQSGIKLTIDYKNTGFSKNQSSINIDGNAKSVEDINKFWANLRENDLFKKSHLNGYNEDKGKGFVFNGKIIIEGVDENVQTQQGQ